MLPKKPKKETSSYLVSYGHNWPKFGAQNLTMFFWQIFLMRKFHVFLPTVFMYEFAFKT